ncbi:hypothetical protein PUN28_015917 [Cardiocondyla obscurior]|uniref:Uncharacterized protein n=1 Tax=Cardiocondyla obscurior TaxID=286306 RepID=A0AAW2ESJ2_9HYME
MNTPISINDTCKKKKKKIKCNNSGSSESRNSIAALAALDPAELPSPQRLQPEA